jgi:hypothetical protein
VNLDAIEQMNLTRDLHSLFPLWVQVQRRIIFARDTAEQVISHPSFHRSGQKPPIREFLIKRIRTLEDQSRRIQELADQTKVLISLVLRIFGLPYLL